MKQTAEHAVKLTSRVLVWVQHLCFRRQRERNMRGRKRFTGRSKPDDDYPAIEGFALA
jgi:hypothetical protein